MLRFEISKNREDQYIILRYFLSAEKNVIVQESRHFEYLDDFEDFEARLVEKRGIGSKYFFGADLSYISYK
jgi:hypothetical protein